YKAGQIAAGAQHGRRAGSVDAQPPDPKTPSLSPGDDSPAARARRYSTSVIPGGPPAMRRDVVTITADEARRELARRAAATRSAQKPGTFAARLRATIKPLKFPEHLTRHAEEYAELVREREQQLGIR
ncbi:MAG: hypothetical protein ACREJX_12865, partial [Polyangiaceae bacterium]